MTGEELTESKEDLRAAFVTWYNNLKNYLVENGELEIRDDNEYGLENGYAKRVFTMDGNHGYVYSPTFDKIRGVETPYDDRLEFHVKDGDGLFKDGSWVSDLDFADDAWMELTVWIVFPDE